MTKRKMITITDELDEKIVGWSKRLGVSQSQLLVMSIQSGLGNILRAFAPEESVSPEMWAKIIKAAQDMGLELKGEMVEKGFEASNEAG